MLYRVWRIFLVLFAIVGASPDSRGKNLTPFGEQSPLLARAEQAFDRIGIDVRSSYTRPSLKSSRPVLSPLGAAVLGPPPAKWPAVEKDLKRGAFGFLAAVPPQAPTESNPSSPAAAPTGRSQSVEDATAAEELRAAWEATDPERRIFLSFTSADRADAMKVRAVLEEQGYVIFTYLKDQGEPLFTVEEVGAFFRTSGERYVLDTPAARKSAGVWIEQSIQQQYKLLETVESALKKLKADDAKLRAWRDARHPLLKVDAEKVRTVVKPLAENLLGRANALDFMLETMFLPADHRREYLRSLQAAWRSHAGGALSTGTALDPDAWVAASTEFRRELERLDHDPAFSLESPAMKSWHFAPPANLPTHFTPPPPPVDYHRTFEEIRKRNEEWETYRRNYEDAERREETGRSRDRELPRK